MFQNLNQELFIYCKKGVVFICMRYSSIYVLIYFVFCSIKYPVVILHICSFIIYSFLCSFRHSVYRPNRDNNLFSHCPDKTNNSTHIALYGDQWVLMSGRTPSGGITLAQLLVDVRLLKRCSDQSWYTSSDQSWYTRFSKWT